MRYVLSELRGLVKSFVNVVALCLVLPCGLTCWLESVLHPSGEGVFNFWSHIFAILPGPLGVYVRRAHYRLTLASCSASVAVGFGAFFAHRESHVEDDVYIGPFAVIGRARLRSGCLIGTRASLLSGSGQHELDAQGRWTAARPTNFRQIEIGPYAWIGEAATVMASVGEGSAVSAGAVVSAPVPAGVIVAGNPARFVRKTRPEMSQSSTVTERPHEPLVQPLH